MSAILTADAQVRTGLRFVYIHFKINAAMTVSHLPYMDISVTQQQ